MKKYVLMALALAAAPFTASAAESAMSYTYIQGGYAKTEIDFDGTTLDLDGGFGIKGSLAFSDSFYGVYGMHQNELDSDNSLSPAEIGAGYHMAINAGTDFIAEVSYLGMNSEVFGEDYHNDGYRVAAGLRGTVGQHVELGAKLTYTGVENFDSLLGVNLNALAKFNDTWGVYGEYHYHEYNFLDGDIDTWQVGVRASF